MRARRRFSAAFKRQVVEELVAGVSTQAQICRRYELCPTLVRTWKQQYAQGQLADPEQVCSSQQERIQELERMVGQLTMENALLKKAVACTLQRRRESSLPVTGPGSDRLQGGAH
jgi:transposase-like protein